MHHAGCSCFHAIGLGSVDFSLDEAWEREECGVVELSVLDGGSRVGSFKYISLCCKIFYHVPLSHLVYS